MRPYLITAKLMRPSNMKRFPTPVLDFIHRLSLVKDARRFGDWSLSPSKGKRTPTLYDPIDRASPYLRT
jgi:hypothetical protein